MSETSNGVTLMDWLQVLAPFLALGLGVLVYGRQKAIDRQDMLLSECRKVYLDYVSAAEKFLEDACSEDNEQAFDKSTVPYRKAFMSLKIYAPDSVIELARPLLMEIVALRDEEKAFEEKAKVVRTRIEDIVAAMREDCVNPQRESVFASWLLRDVLGVKK